MYRRKYRPLCISLLLVFYLLCAVSDVTAQTSEYYSTKQGLPSTRINKILFDENNFLWVATDLGLSRFNGKNFVNYQANEDDKYSLQQNRVNSIFEAKDKSHWLGASDGLYYLCRTKNSFTRYPVLGEQTNVSVADIEQHPLRPNTLVLSTFGYGLQFFNIETRTYDHAAADSLTALFGNQDIPHFHIDSQQRIWAFKNKWVSVVDLRTMREIKLRTPIPESEQQEIKIKNAVEDCSGGYIYMTTLKHGILIADTRTMEIQHLSLPVRYTNALALSPDCKLVVGTECEGLWLYEPETRRYQKASANGNINLDQAKVQCLGFDAQENLWLGIFQQGLIMLPGPKSIFTCHPITPSLNDNRNLGCSSTFAILEDGSRAYGLDGQGLVVDWVNGERTHYDTKNSVITSSAIMDLQPISDGRLIISTYQGGIYALEKDRKIHRIESLSELDHSYIRALAYDAREQIIFIGVNGVGIYEYDIRQDKLKRTESKNKSVTWINDLYVSRKEKLWISSPDVLHCMDIPTRTVNTPKQGNTVTSVHSLTEDDQNDLWIASNKGLLKYDEANDTILQIHEDNVEKKYDYASIFFNSGRLWLASTGAITCYEPQTGQFIRYQDQNIANVGTMSNDAVQQWKDSAIWFGGDNGAVGFHPEKVINYDLTPSPLFIQQLWVDNVPTDYVPALGDQNVLDASLWCATRLRLSHEQASFSITYCQRDVNGSLGYTYGYRLKGYESAWHQMLGDAMTASYQSLPPGSYELEIRAVPNNDNPDREHLMHRLQVVILAPWYATWWAKILWLILTIAIIGFTMKEFMERRREKKALLEAELTRKAKEEKLDLLTSVSHEIKTPLTLIISPLRKLMERKSEPAMQTVLDMMYRNSLRILMLVNQQMDVRKMDHGQLLLHVKELPLRSFLDDIMQYFSNTALSHHINYRLEFSDSEEEEEEASVWADPSQLDKVLLNLLSNAFKFTPEKGDVILSVSDTTLTDGAEATRISVYNSGSHLTPSEQPKAFTGIGLSIARELTKLHHGSLSVRNLQNGVAFDIDLLKGNSHFTAEQLATIEEETANHEELDKINEDLREKSEELGDGDEEQQQKERELIEQLSDELREKQRLRERRQTLDINYSEIQMSSADEKLMRRVTDVIHKNMANSDFSVETLSSEVGISRVHLNRKLKELIDTSPSALIRSIRLKQAAFLLIQSNVTVAEVAYAVGFSSPAYFSSNFSQYFGMTPKEFTSNYTENPDSPELKQLLNQ